MHFTRGFFLSFVSCFLALTLLAPRSVVAQSPEKTEQRLATARRAYEGEMVEVRRGVIAAIKATSKASKDTPDAAQKAHDDTKAFSAAGAWPEGRIVSALRDRSAKAADAMLKAYAKAMTDSLGTPFADVFAAEKDQFARQRDIVPWRDVLTAKEPEPARTLAPGGKPLSVETGLEGEYRVEIKGERVGDAGTLSVEFPLGEGKRLTIPTVVGDKGKIWVLLSVRKQLVSADLGVARPIDVSKAIDGGGNAIVLRADGGRFVVESVRAKPIVEGGPEQLAEKPKMQNQNGKPAVVVVDPLPLDSKWGGDFNQDGSFGRADLEGKIVERTGDVAVLKTNNVNGAGSIVWTFRVHGNNIRLDNIRYEGVVGNLTDASGGGTADGTTFNFTFDCKITMGKMKNQPAKGTVALKPR